MRRALAAEEARAIGAVTDLLARLDFRACDGCDGCGLRCTAGIPMTYEEYERVERFLGCVGGVSPAQPCDEERHVDLGDSVHVSVCRFRDMESGRCRIYPVRPLVCRLMGLVAWMPCPIGAVREVAPTDSVLAALDEYCAQKRQPYEAWRAECGSREGK